MPQLGIANKALPSGTGSHQSRLGEQSKMKMHHDQRAKFWEMAMGDTVLARDHLSSQKWQSGIVQQHSSPHSYQIQLEDGRIWRHHVDDVLQNTPSLKPVGAATSTTSAGVVPHSQSAVPASADTPSQDELGEKDTPLAPPTLVLRRSMPTLTPPQ